MPSIEPIPWWNERQAAPYDLCGELIAARVMPVMSIVTRATISSTYATLEFRY
jgi:hypothetical protein